VRFCAASDQAVLVYLGEEIGLSAHERVLKLLRVLESNRPVWLRNLQPAYCSLLVSFDPCLVDHAAVEASLREFEQRAEIMPPAKRKTIEIPVCYDPEFGLDLEEVARLHRLTPGKVIQHHCSSVYHAYFLGFAPGFVYLGDLPPEIATPRLATPRKQVPPGSVAIAGRQTAVYPFAMPGGWRLLGRTPLSLFRADREPMGLVSIGDQVRFRSISRDEFLKREST
jgi:KipI family sensor histidine kinase inhibitor